MQIGLSLALMSLLVRNGYLASLDTAEVGRQQPHTRTRAAENGHQSYVNEPPSRNLRSAVSRLAV